MPFRFRWNGIFCTEVSGIFFDVHAGGGKGKIHTVSLHDIHDIQVQVVLHLQELGVDIGHQIGGDQNVDAGIPKVCQLHDVGALVGIRAGIQHGLQVFHQLFQLGTGGVVGDAKVELIGTHGAQGRVLYRGGTDPDRLLKLNVNVSLIGSVIYTVKILYSRITSSVYI